MYSGNLRVTLHNLHAGSWLKQLLPRLLLEHFFFRTEICNVEGMVQQMLPPSSGVSGGALLRQDGLRSIVSRQKCVKEHCFMTRI